MDRKDMDIASNAWGNFFSTQEGERFKEKMITHLSSEKLKDLREAREELQKYGTIEKDDTDMPKKEKKWRIELTEHQLMLMARCVEDCHRFMSGQMEMSNSTRVLEHPCVLWDKLRELQPYVSPGVSIGASYDWAGRDCPNRDQKKFVAETYYLYRSIYEANVRERAKTEDFPLGSTYLSKTLTCKDSGEPIKVERIK